MQDIQFGDILNALLYTGLGLVALCLFSLLMVKLPGLGLWHESARQGNTAAGLICGALILGGAIIIAATLH